MGYYTNYELEIIDKPYLPLTDEEAVIERFMEISGYTNEGGPFEDGCKWYDHDSNARAVSRFFPSCILKIEGKGEEHGDHWVDAYMNGDRIWKWSASRSYPPSIDVPGKILVDLGFLKSSVPIAEELSVAEQFNAILDIFHGELK